MQTLTQNTGLYTDFYELTMAQAYFYSGKQNETSKFDYFFRTNPYKGGYIVFAGLQDLLHILSEFSYNDENLAFLKKAGLKDEFLNYLKDFSFKGKIYSMKEGEIAFPYEPIIRVEGNMIECLLIETLLLNYLNFQSLIATKACRIRSIIGDKVFSDFGLRRAQGLGGIHASRAAIIGGADSTSNVYAAFIYGIPVSGTQAHAWVQSFDKEIDAFRQYAEINPDTTVLLVDTYNTLKSGIPNAIIIAKELEAKGLKLVGIRLDSGDLAYLSKKGREILDDAGLSYVQIFASNQLNEYVIKSLNEQGARIDGYGIGTELVTGNDTGALDGVYKLVENNNKPSLKVSENIEKMTLPGRKKVVRYFDKNGKFFSDGILMVDEENANKIYHPFLSHKTTNLDGCTHEVLNKLVMDNGEILIKEQLPSEINVYLKQRYAQLPDEHKRFISPHIYKVGVSEKVLKLKNDILKSIQEKVY
ncbi:nicotinate phosphoribosyltransferase [Ancylomarina sp. 16SWW S1-10-2]|uniref:nicotinate phosphoribosyltransferase n=1 Tax=Ancylomarina sp. 16SWW S1-10-2 TaxID=2499681 RepID=UPI0012ADDEAF|nr:nicotinate phosphoribosyltransferase [Ancylomarina sp. 16SWW S1-10-2]MRT93732.1 nicotinate phosphoribosyltransferase [Ancylomarina sp. 16SWW S1-10-2]